MFKTLFRYLLPIVGVVIAVAAVIVAGNIAMYHLRQQQQYQIAFADILCPSPPGMKQSEFLDEVQYLSQFPETVHLLEEDLPKKLADAFARHPWVEEVEKVQVLLPLQISVQLRFRRPVLAVRWNGQLRAVDEQGILLPPSAATEDLPVYAGKPSPPKGPAGTPWGDAEVLKEARQAAEELD